MPDCTPVTKTMSQDSARTTAVLIAVAIFEFTPSIPIFARIEVNAANTEDKIAKIIEDAGLSPTVRGERLSVSDYARLADLMDEATENE